MYAGTLNVSINAIYDDHNLFYWHFKNTSIPADVNTGVPLVVWINGGPGSSSMFGLFLENGPIRVSRTGTTMDDFVVNPSYGSWGDIADIVFLDQPVGTGFSYGNYYLDRMDYGAEEYV
jgi:carboxypeptidase D